MKCGVILLLFVAIAGVSNAAPSHDDNGIAGD
jgi:hypothetical protein